MKDTIAADPGDRPPVRYPGQVILTPDQYGQASVADLFAAAARGHAAVDHRFLHAILDNMPANLPAVIEYANRSREGERYDVSVDLMRVFAVHPVPEAIPFLIREIRRFPDEIPDEMAEALVRIGKPAVEPLLEVAAEFKHNRDVMFVVAAAGVGDPRVNALIEEIEAEDEDEGDYLRGVWHAGEVRPEEPPYDIWKEYEERSEPDFDGLPREEVLEFLSCSSPELRRAALAALHRVELDEDEVRLVLDAARNDSDTGVRAEAWEVLRDHTGNKEVEAAMRARIDDPATPEDEHVSLCLGLREFLREPAMRAHVVRAYENPATRARALDAMWNSPDTSFREYFKRHLDDEDVDIRRAVVWGIGAFGMKEELKRLEALLTDEEFRDDALFNYALAAPARPSRFDLSKLGNVIEQLAGGLNEEEAEIVHRAFDSRLVEAGKPPIFSEWAAVEDDEEEESAPAPPPAPAAGRNDPCPCGSGKKFKKCCGK